MNTQAYRGWLFALALALLALATAAPAKTIRIDPDGNGDFSTIAGGRQRGPKR